nr:helix-turn-helix domain-containing protein [Bacillus sp. FJAT-22090]
MFLIKLTGALLQEGVKLVNQICEITNVSRASLYRKLSVRNS